MNSQLSLVKFKRRRIDRWMDKKAVVHIYNGIILSHKNEVDEPRDYYTEWNAKMRKTNIVYYCIYMESRKMARIWTYLQGQNRDADIENRPLDTVGEGEGGMNRESSMETHTLPYLNYIASGDLLYDSGSSNLCSLTTHRGRMGWEVGGSFKSMGTYGWFMLMYAETNTTL